MKLATALTIALATMASTARVAEAKTNPITIKGYKMFDVKTGAYFSARGIDYYPRPNAGELDANNVDFFTDDHYDVWSKDLKHLAESGANAIRLYAVDPSKSHDKFMCALSALGIYVLVDLGASCKGCAITNDKYPTCYPSTLKSRGEQIILAFAKYDNVLAFSAGNEVNHVVTDPTINAPCQKKFIKDMRAFLSKCNTKMRAVPVGVVLADHQREANAKYYNCRTDAADTLENAEWYGLNAYQYCDATVTEVTKAAGFSELVSTFLSYKTSVPVMLTEFGCLDKSFPTVNGYEAQRNWLQAGWLFTKAFRKVFSGGFVFEYSTENANSKGDSPYPFTKYGAQNYGLGYYTPEDCDHVTKPCTYVRMPNYKNLATQYNSTDTSDEVAMADFTPASDRSTLPKCPPGFANLKSAKWEADSAASLACPADVVTFTCPANSAVVVTDSTTGASGNSDGAATSPSTKAKTKAKTSTNAPADTTAANAATANAGSISSRRTLVGSIATIALSTVLAALFV